MAATKGAAERKAGMQVDTALVRELAELLAETGLSEIEVEDGDRKVRVARGGVAMQAVSAPMAAPMQAPAASAAAAPGTDSPDLAATAPDGDRIPSPMVGTAYLAPEPGAEDFVKVGDAVKKGDTLLIIEAMKVMNPITAPRDGTVKALLIGNGDPVEFDQPLAIVG